ncbi:Uncharacterised protein [Riemerella anatipestifer]|nr:Uncharacterised protein [Riemerella anatipestifer]
MINTLTLEKEFYVLRVKLLKSWFYVTFVAVNF